MPHRDLILATVRDTEKTKVEDQRSAKSSELARQDSEERIAEICDVTEANFRLTAVEVGAMQVQYNRIMKSTRRSHEVAEIDIRCRGLDLSDHCTEHATRLRDL